MTDPRLRTHDVWLDGARYEPPAGWSVVRVQVGTYGWIDMTRVLEGWGQAARSQRVRGRVELVHRETGEVTGGDRS